MKNKLLIVVLAVFFFTACNEAAKEEMYSLFKSSEGDKSAADYSAGNAQEPPPPASESKGANYNIITTDASGSLSGTASGWNTSDQKDGAFQNTTDTVGASLSISDDIASAGMSARVKTPEKIIKNANVNISVEYYKKSRSNIEAIIKSSNAYIASENEQNNSYSISNTMVIRVLNKDFDALVNKLTEVALNVNSKNITTDDVTAQFVDIISRIKTKKEVKERYEEILRKAQKIQDILDVEERIRAIQEEIEAKEGQLKFLSDQVAYSTVNLTFYQSFEYQAPDRPGFFSRLWNAMSNGWSGLLSFIVGLMNAWPLWIILGIGGWFLYRFIKRQVKKK